MILSQHYLDSADEPAAGTSNSDDDDDFFSSMNIQSCRTPGELERYLRPATQTMNVLNYFPSIKKLSVYLNMPLPTSAACENQLPLKLNSKYWQ